MNKLMTAQGALLLALGTMLASPAMACPDCQAKTAATTPTTAPTADALTVVRDRETGALRAPTAAEAANMQRRAEALQAARIGNATPAAEPLLRTHAAGARSVRLTAEFASYSVVRKNADGTLDQSCVQGKDAAMQAMSPLPAAQRRAALETE